MLKLRDLKSVIMAQDYRVIVSLTFNKGIEWKDLLALPDSESIWDSEVVLFTESELYDLVIKVRP